MRVVGRSGVVMSLSEQLARGLIRSGAVRQVGEPAAEQPAPDPQSADQVGALQRPPSSGQGSGVQAWREYAATMTGTAAADWAGMSRAEIAAAVDTAPEWRHDQP